MFGKLGLATIWLALTTLPGLAGDEGRTVRGVGNASCAEWTQFRANRSAASYQVEAWVEGFLSGYNMMAGHDFLLNRPAKVAMDAWIDNYCATHPLDPIARATFKLKDELGGPTPE